MKIEEDKSLTLHPDDVLQGVALCDVRDITDFRMSARVAARYAAEAGYKVRLQGYDGRLRDIDPVRV